MEWDKCTLGLDGWLRGFLYHRVPILSCAVGHPANVRGPVAAGPLACFVPTHPRMACVSKYVPGNQYTQDFYIAKVPF